MMKKRIRLAVVASLLALTMAFALCGCADKKAEEKKALLPQEIELGMTREEVHSIYGEPNSPGTTSDTYTDVDKTADPSVFKSFFFNDSYRTMKVTYDSNDKVIEVYYSIYDNYFASETEISKLLEYCESLYGNGVSGSSTAMVVITWKDKKTETSFAVYPGAWRTYGYSIMHSYADK